MYLAIELIQEWMICSSLFDILNTKMFVFVNEFQKVEGTGHIYIQVQSTCSVSLS